MRIIFYNIKETIKPYSMKEFDIVTINDDIDISFKDDRIYIYGQGHHYSEFLYKSTLINTSLVDVNNLSTSDKFILERLRQKFKEVEDAS